MYCRNCSSEVSIDAIACPKCGVPPLKGKHFCNNCGAPTHEDAIICVNCGVEFKKPLNSTSSDLTLNVKTEDIVQGWGKYSYSTYVIILLFSLLPFINIKCAGTNVVSVTGYDMAIGKEINNINGEMVNLFRWDVLAFYIIIVVCLFLVDSKKYIQALKLTGLSFLLLLRFTYIIYSKLKDNDVPSINYSFGLGFWLTLGLIVLTLWLLEEYIALNKINPKPSSPPLAESDKIILPPPSLLDSNSTITPPPLFDLEQKGIQLNEGVNEHDAFTSGPLFISESINEKKPSLSESDTSPLFPPIPSPNERIQTEIEHSKEETSNVYQQILNDEKKVRLRNRIATLFILVLIIIIGVVIWFSSNRNNKQAEPTAINDISQNANNSLVNNKGGAILTNLSKYYVFSITVKKEPDEHGDPIIKTIIVNIINKSNQQIKQTIVINGEYFSTYTDFQDIESVRSSITGVNENKDIIDGDYGNFIVDDFNMDDQEDFAIKTNCGEGSSGCHYKYYTLRNDGNFKEDTFLTNEISNPPDIDTKSKTISIHHINWDLPNTSDATPQGYIRIFYSYNSSNEKWTKIKTVYEDENGDSISDNTNSIAITEPFHFILDSLNRFSSSNSLKIFFGDKNIESGTFESEMGNQYFSTVYANTKNEVKFYWNQPYSNLRCVEIDKEGTNWKTSDGITVGMPINEIIHINSGKKISFYGFEIDTNVEGLVTSFNDGNLSKRNIGLYLRPNTGDQNLYNKFLGGSFTSDMKSAAGLKLTANRVRIW